MAAPINQSLVHVDEPLSEFSLAFLQSADKFVAWRVFPNLPVLKQSDRYWQFPRQYFFTEAFQKRADGGLAGEVTWEVDSTPTYFCDVWAEKVRLKPQMLANVDRPLSPENQATRLLTGHAMVKLEKDWVATYFTDGVWTTDWAGVSAAPSGDQVLQWNDADSTPLEDIEALKVEQGELTGYEPNKLVIGRKVWKALRNHPEIVDRVKYGQTPGRPAEVTRQAVAALMELDEILVTSSIQNTAKENLTPAYSYIAGNHALLAYAPGVVGWEEPVAGMKISWTGYQPGTNEQGGSIRSWFSQDNKCTFLELEMAYTHKVVSPDLAVFIKDVVAG